MCCAAEIHAMLDLPRFAVASPPPPLPHYSPVPHVAYALEWGFVEMLLLFLAGAMLSVRVLPPINRGLA